MIHLFFTFSDPEFNRDDDTQAASMMVANQNMQRNIRCCLAYHNTRLTRVERLAWETGKHVPDHLLEKISPVELEY